MSQLPRRTYQAHFRSHCLILFALLCAFPVGTHGQTTWDGSEADDNWFNPNNWDTGMVPNGITEDAIVGAPSPTFFTSAVTLNSLTVGADGILNANWHMTFGGTATTTLDNMGTIIVGPGADFQLSAQANNSGSIEVNGVAGIADLQVASSGATLDDGGTVTFNHPNARISGLSGATLNIADQTLQGFGQIGSNTVELINATGGFIDANSAGNTLTIDTNAAGGVNQGTMQASSGGILRINGSNLDNAGSSIQALAGSTVELSGTSGASANITGGTLSGTGTFNVVAGQFAGLTDLTHSGTLNVENNAHLRLTGAINNTGNISVNSTAQIADLQIQAAGATLDGGGTVTFTHPSSQINGAAGATLTIANQTLQGYGNIGANTVELNNTAGGLINANSAGNTLIVDTSAAGGVNQGIMRASAGGILRINGANINNTGGSIQALAGSKIELTGGSDITGGTLSGAGTFNAVSGQTGILTDLTHSATIEVNNNSHLGLAGTINNTGSISVNSTSQVADLIIQSSGATLTGGGTITLSSDNAKINGNAGSVLTIADQTIQGYGNIGGNSVSEILFQGGFIHANMAGETLDIDQNTFVGPHFAHFTEGTDFRASNGATLESKHGLVVGANSNSGSLHVETDSTVDVRYVVINSGSTLSGDGTIATDPQIASTSVGGVIAPGEEAGDPIGTLQIFGDLIGSEFQFELASATSYDSISVLPVPLGRPANGFVQVDNGSLAVSLLDNFIPDNSDQFVLLQGTASASNSFSDGHIDFANVASGETLVTEDGRGSFTVAYSSVLNSDAQGSSSIVLSNFQLFTADFDEDGDVDGSDFLTWQRSLGVDDGGDADFDGDTDQDDLLIWQASYGQSAALASSTVAVPEPSSFLLAMAALLSVGRYRWR